MPTTDPVKWIIQTPHSEVHVEAESATVDTHGGELHILTPRPDGGRDIVAAFAPGQWESVEKVVPATEAATT